ncbi:MAG: sigma-54-dependent Fis family transcriptional regulator [Deltaproteobacteria bacterium]|nr:sigma-54-dependent Fis family transcriptional regulator [Deltaproteobacteria bacterium]
MQANHHILVVDDSVDTLEVLRRNLVGRGYRTTTATSAEDALRILESTPVNLVITDIRMPGADGLDLLRYVQENYKNIAVVIITGYPRYDEAIRAMKIGAEEYLIKPFTDEELCEALNSAFEKQHLRENLNRRLVPHIKYGLIGQSEGMQKLFDQIGRAASTDATILIQGESGTGKELIARAIHYESPRNSAPFVPVNCGSIPETLLESELFGHIKGAFTGANWTKAGFFQTADTGTILLDEISEASPSMQVKLLRVLQEKEICMLGATRSIHVDVRIIAATNKDLSALTTKGIFREDLFYRLNVISINVPPLRDRDDDIILLINHFVKKFVQEYGQSPPEISGQALKVLKAYHWPGNVRELENVIMRILSMTQGDVVEVPDLPSLMRFSSLMTRKTDRTLAAVESEYIREVLAETAGNKTAAATILGINRRTLREKLKKNNPA